jgi:hypothetical protein
LEIAGLIPRGTDNDRKLHCFVIAARLLYTKSKGTRSKPLSIVRTRLV